MLFLSAEEVGTLADAIHPHFRVLIYTGGVYGACAQENSAGSAGSGWTSCAAVCTSSRR